MILTIDCLSLFLFLCFFTISLFAYIELTNWLIRPLSSQQLEYAALDAACTPQLTERVLESIEANISMDQLQQVDRNTDTFLPVIQRWDDDLSLIMEIFSYRFLLLPENTDEATISEMQARQIVGSSWVASSVWIAGEEPPPTFFHTTDDMMKPKEEKRPNQSSIS
ncbi:MAG: hypothetical protein ACI8RD_010714 [Bacillariaceae sp.]